MSAIYAWLFILAIVIIIVGGHFDVQSAGFNIIGWAALYVIIYVFNVICGGVGWTLAGLLRVRPDQVRSQMLQDAANERVIALLDTLARRSTGKQPTADE